MQTGSQTTPLTEAMTFRQGTQLAHSDTSDDGMRKKSPTSLPACCLLMLSIGQRSRSAFQAGRRRAERRLEWKREGIPHKSYVLLSVIQRNLDSHHKLILKIVLFFKIFLMWTIFKVFIELVTV